MIKTVILDQNKPVIRCGECITMLQMTNNRGVRCPKCKTFDLLEQPPTMILCCAECDQPLAVLDSPEGLGSYCLRCDFAPSMQDTFLQKI